MPIYDVSYRKWIGPFDSPSTRWLTITTTEISRASKSKHLRRLLFAAILPLLFFSIPFFLFEQSTQEPATWQMFSRFALNMPQASLLRESIEKVAKEVDLGEKPRQRRPAFRQRMFQAPVKEPTPEEFDKIRHEVWAFMLLTFLRYPQAVLMVIVVGIVAPTLISQDLRTRAYLIYFARPITRMEYILGKFGVVAFFLACISTLPALLLYVAAVLLSSSFSVIFTTWDLPMRIVLASVFLIVPTTLVALAFSSLTTESRYAGFAWFAIWIVGHVTYSSLVAIPTMEANQSEIAFEPGWRLLTSPYQVLGIVQSYAFGFTIDDSTVIPAFVLVSIVSIASLLVLYRRVASPLNA